MNGLFAPELAQWSGPLLRNYWSDDRTYTVDIGGSSSSSSDASDQDLKKSIYVPLGPRQEFLFIDDTERSMWPATQRPRLFNLLVTLSTHPTRAKIATVVEEIQGKAEAKAAISTQLNNEVFSHRKPTTTKSKHLSHRNQRQRPEEILLAGEETALVHNAKKWRPFLPPDCDHKAKNRKRSGNCESHLEGAEGSTAAPEDGMSSSSSSSSTAAPHADVANFTGLYNGHNLPTEAYRRVLLESVFTICPPGHSSETFRLFEAVEAGSIPIVDEAFGFSGSEQLAGTSNKGVRKKSSVHETKPRRRLKGASAATATGQCVDPMRPFRDSGAPFLWITDWETELAPLLAKLRRAPTEVLARQKALAVW